MGTATSSRVAHGSAVAGERDLAAYLSRAQLGWPERSGEWRSVDGTLVFADVSGFTPLTERLAALGKAGAEELTDVLNRVFGQTLLPEAAGFGGDLLKFGGDALFLLFEGPNHALRACAAADGMQRALRPFRRLRTANGHVSLRMSVGVASGPVYLFLAGGSHRELLVAGPTVTAATEQESAAGPGQVLLGSKTAVLVPGRHLGPIEGPGVLLASAPSTEPWRSEPTRGITDPATGVPSALRRHLGSRREGEHRMAVLTFLQFTGTDRLLEREGPEALARALDQLVRAVQEACEQRDVCFLATDVDRDGGKILLVAGAPTAHEDDPDRMLLALREAVPVSSELRVRAGVNRGRAFAVDVGSRDRRTFAVMGDATNLAARVMGKAANGQIVATRAVLERVRTRFVLDWRDPFTVKGKSLPVDAAVVGDAVAVDRAWGEGARSIVGRDAELAAIREAVDGARSGRGVVVDIVGEAGIGKSRLLEAGLEVADEVRVVRVEAAQYASSTPYFALRAPLRSLLGLPADADDAEVESTLRRWVRRFAPQLASRLPLLGIPLGVDVPDTAETAEVDAAFRRRAIETVVHRALVELLPGPTVIAVEDTHWLDDATAELLASTAATASTRPWAFLLTRRPGTARIGDGSFDAVSVRLAPLGHDVAAELVRAVSGGLKRSVIQQVIERSAGNPLFLTELVAAAEEGALDELPDTVESVIAARIDSLAPPARRLLRYASVLGGRVDLTILRRLVDASDPRALEALPDVERFLLPDGEGRRRFHHALVRDVAYETLPFRSRRELHGRAGQLLEDRAGGDTEEWSDLLSFHFHAAGRHVSAWKYSLQAGERARHNAAPRDAVTFYRRAVESGRALQLDPAELGSACEILGDVCELSGDYDAAASAYRSARGFLVGRELDRVRIGKKQGWVRERSSRYPQALRWYTRGLTALAGRQDVDGVRLRGELTLAYGAVRLRQGRYREASSLLLDAVRLADGVGDRRTLAHGYYLLDWALTDLGDPAAHTYRSLALPIFEELGDLVGQGNVLNNIGVDAYYEGRWDEAIVLYERSRSLRERSGDIVQMGTASNNIGEIRSDQGHLSEAEALFQESLTVWSDAPWPLGIALAVSNLGRVAARSGREAADQILQEAEERFADLGAEAFVVETVARRAEHAVLVGRADEALERARAIEARPARAGELPVVRAMISRVSGYAHLQLGRADLAETAFVEAALVAAAANARFETALVHEGLSRLAGVLGDRERATRELAAARELFGELGIVRTPDVPARAR